MKTESKIHDTEDPKIELGTEPASGEQIPLEQKYREQMRQIVSQKIELPISTLSDMIEDQIDLSPGFQRRGRWDTDRRSRFIESIIMNVPIPPVFLGEDDYGKYVVLDGRQRLTAVHEFLRNAYALKGLKVWTELIGSRWLDLQKKKLDRTLTRRFIPAVVILKESSAEVKYDVFDRLNTGGVIAEPMEIRNAIYRGTFTKLLHDLSDEKVFRQLWDIPLNDEDRENDATYRRMDDVELILRFFALRDVSKMDMNFRDYLGEFMRVRNEEYKKDSTLLDLDRELFNRASQNTWTVFKGDAFRRPQADNTFRSTRSAPLADAVMIALADVPTEAVHNASAEYIRNKFRELCLNDEGFKKAIGTGTNGKGAIAYRVQAMRDVVEQAKAIQAPQLPGTEH